MSKTKRAAIPPQLKAELATLETDQLEAVAKLAASLLGGKYVPKEKVTKTETGGQHARAEVLYEALSVELYRKRRMESKPFQLLLSRQDPLVKTFLAKHAEFDRFLDRACGAYKLTDAERWKFYSVGANIVADALIKADLPMSMTTLVNWLSSAPSQFDLQFPGYIKSGLLHVIVFASLQKPISGQKGAVVEVRREEPAAGKQQRLSTDDIKNRYRSRRGQARRA